MMTEDTICRLILAARKTGDYDSLRAIDAYIWFTLPAGYQDSFGLFSDVVPCWQGGN